MISPYKNLLLFLKGFCMGTADIIPGVSGGTVALILGIYKELITTISSVNLASIKVVLSFDIKAIQKELNLHFLVPLFLGIVSAILIMARIMHFFMDHYSTYTWSLFLGLILGSILFLLKQIPNLKSNKHIFFLILGSLIGYGIVSLVPVTTPEDSWFIFLAGFIAISAMILPGISGSFILLLMGKYAFITGAIKNPFAEGSLELISVFSLGCLFGILSFSRVLKYCLNRFYGATMSLLAGFMIGSLKKLWPWREVVSEKIIRGKVYILEEVNVFPTDFSFQTILAFCIMFFAFTLIVFLEKIRTS